MGRGELFRSRSPEGPSKNTLRVTAPCMMFDISGRPQTRSLSCPLFSIGPLVRTSYSDLVVRDG